MDLPLFSLLSEIDSDNKINQQMFKNSSEKKQNFKNKKIKKIFSRREKN
jgi:hypothetical protein